MTRMFDSFDPLQALQLAVEQNRLQAQQIAELQAAMHQASQVIHQHSELIAQLTQQNTEILMLWAAAPPGHDHK